MQNRNATKLGYIHLSSEVDYKITESKRKERGVS